MPTNVQRKAALMARAETVFQRHVIDGVSLRDLAPEVGVSVETARNDVQTFKQYLADVDRAELPAKRAARLVELEDLKARALALYDRYKDSKPLTAVGALNTAMAAFTHIRAIEGLDAPKEARLQGEVSYRVVWDDGDDFDGGYGEAPAPGLQRLTTKPE